MIARSGMIRLPYTGSSGPRQTSQIAIGAGSNLAPQFAHACGRAASDAAAASGNGNVTAAVILRFLPAPATKTSRSQKGRGTRGLFSKLFNVAAIGRNS